MKLTYSGYEIQVLKNLVVYRRPVSSNGSYRIERGVVEIGEEGLQFRPVELLSCCRYDFRMLQISLFYNQSIKEEGLNQILKNERG